jgi:hypothetical protein
MNDRKNLQDELTGASVWRHRKRGSVYTVIGVSRGIVYYVNHANGGRWWRPLEEFLDGRFELSAETPLSEDEAGFSRG